MTPEAKPGLRAFLMQRKKFWLVPLALVLLVFGLLVLLSLGSEGNFVYTLN